MTRAMHWMGLSASVVTMVVAQVLPAAADSAAAPTYASAVSGSSVEVTTNLQASCPSDAMLRINTGTGAVVQLAGFCASAFPFTGDGGYPTSSTSEYTYVDECVPAGTYRYGLATPYACGGDNGGAAVPYYATVTVTAALASTCALSTGDTGATATDGGVPWPATGDGDVSCPKSGGGCTSTSTTVFGINGSLLLLSLVLLKRRSRLER